MVYFELFFSFVKIGFSSFGGVSMIPLILQEMESHGWMTEQDLTNLIGIAEMTPGPLGINCATFAGNRSAGILGGLAAVIGVLMPVFTLTLLAGIFFRKFKKSHIMQNIMSFVKPVCIAMIIAIVLTLSLSNYLPKGNIDGAAIFIGLFSLMLLQKKKKASVLTVLLISAGMGLLWYGLILPRI